MEAVEFFIQILMMGGVTFLLIVMFSNYERDVFRKEDITHEEIIEMYDADYLESWNEDTRAFYATYTYNLTYAAHQSITNSYERKEYEKLLKQIKKQGKKKRQSPLYSKKELELRRKKEIKDHARNQSIGELGDWTKGKPIDL